MDKVALISMFVTFATSNDVLKFEPHNTGSIGTGVSSLYEKPKFCKSLDCPEFRVIQTNKDFEEREYLAANWVSTNLTEISYEDAGSVMFMRLFGYISGANKKKEKIAMTCPVTNRIIPADGPACKSDFIMSFYISPKVINAPAPSKKEVYLSETPKKRIYVRQFGGFARSFKTWADEAEKLGKALDARKLKYETKYYYTAGYDAPFTLFNRHNEVWFVALDEQ